MKKTALLLLGLCCYAATKAQFSTALIGGPHGASTTPVFTLRNGDSLVSNKRTALHVGMLANVQLERRGHFFFQSGIVYSAKGSNVVLWQDTAKSAFQNQTTKLSVAYLDVPLNLLVKLPLKGKTKLIVSGGPQASLFYNGTTLLASMSKEGFYAEEENNDLPVGKKEKGYEVLHFGYNASAGLEFGRVFVTAHYTSDLTPFYNEAQQQPKHTTVGATLGIYLGQPQAYVPTVKDRDNDGVPDRQDACPTEAGTALTRGCPDKNANGIADKDEVVPAIDTAKVADSVVVPDVAVVVADSSQKAFENILVKDSAQEKQSSPVAEKPEVERPTFASRLVLFEFTKVQLTPSAQTVLDEVVELLRTHADVTVSLEGHTSGKKNTPANQLLSQQRADWIKAYLIRKGIAAERITALGYGASKPLNDNRTLQQQAANRRVEIRFVNQ